MSVVTEPLTRRRFTVEEYHRMAEAGVLTEDDRVELLDGEVVEMVPIGPRHASHVNRLTRLFSTRVGEDAIVSVQNPVILGPHWEPEPDVALLRPRPDFYAESHPRPEDVLLVVEVMESSAERDRTVKVPAYAAAGVPEVWLVDLAAERIEACRGPGENGYREVRTLERRDRISPVRLPDVEVIVRDVLA